MDCTDNNLRKRLDEISRIPIENQVGVLNSVSGIFPHSIRLVREMRKGSREVDANCHEYTTGLLASDMVASIARSYTDVFLNDRFILWFMENVLDEVQLPDCRESDFVVYFSSANPTHSGLWKDGRVESKWGSGHIWNHEIWEVPASYGNHIKAFRGLKRGECLQQFLRYAEQVIPQNRQARLRLSRKSHVAELLGT